MENNNKKPWAFLVPFNFNLPIGRISKNSFTVGRGITCDLILHEPYISHKHITINKRSQGRGHQYTLVCHSKNKIYLNTNPITDSKNKLLKNNDQIWLVNRNIVSNCRTIGFLFKTQDISQSEIILQKYNRDLVGLQKLATEIKLILNCTRCNQMMPSPISLQPCCHKVCENCGIWMIQKFIDKCLVEGCNRKIWTLMEDSTFSNLTKAYSKYKLGQQKGAKSFYFSQNPFLMQNWIKYNLNRNKSKNTNQRVKNRSGQKEQQQIHQEPQTTQQHTHLLESNNIQAKKSIPQSISKIEKHKYIQQSSQNLEKPIQRRSLLVQGLQQLYNVFSEIQYLSKSQELQSQRFEPTSQHANSFKAPVKIQCRNCQKPFPFSLKKIEKKQCQVCLHQFCNKEFPPCKNLQQPLKFLSQRLSIPSKEHILAMIQQNLRTIISNIFLANIRKTSQLSNIFEYVLLKNNGCFIYISVKQNSLKRIKITLQSGICDQCWPSVARQMLLNYLKLHKNKLKTFCRKDIEETIAETSQLKR